MTSGSSVQTGQLTGGPSNHASFGALNSHSHHQLHHQQPTAALAPYWSAGAGGFYAHPSTFTTPVGPQGYVQRQISSTTMIQNPPPSLFKSGGDMIKF